MAEPREQFGEMSPPSTVSGDPKAKEVLRAWIAHNRLHLTFNPTIWPDPAHWGILVVDLMRHLARAYESEKVMNADVAFARIRAAVDAELSAPTDEGTTDPDRPN